MSDLTAVLAMARKDLRQELRSRAATVATLFFSGITLVIVAFALGRDSRLLAQAAPGVLWVAVVFAGVISAAQSFQSDREEGALEQTLSLPVSRASVYLGKLLANWLYLSVLGLVMTPIALVLYGSSGLSGSLAPLLIVITVLLGSLGFSTIATFYAALTANLQAREALLPVLMFPVVVPILLAAVRATESLTGSADGGPAGEWMLLLAGFDLIYLVLCASLFHLVVEE